MISIEHEECSLVNVIEVPMARRKINCRDMKGQDYFGMAEGGLCNELA